MRPARFPVDSLPEGLRGLYTDHPNAAMAALTIVAGANGSSARVRRQTTQETVSGELFLVIQADEGHGGCLAALLVPMREFQRRVLADAGSGLNGEALQMKEARIGLERQQFLANDYFPEPEHIQYF